MIRAHGGHIAYSQGDGLMAYFGFPQAAEDDPERSIRAGLDLCQKLGHLKTASPEPLRVRVGIATGIVVVGDADDQSISGAIVVGETPNLAARLQQVAEPNEVIVAEATRRLGGAMFDYESRGALDFKGFSDPVPVYRVIGESAAPSRFEAQATAGLNPIVGRDEELKRLRRLWRSALAGEGGFALVGGEPGIGKSRLARAFIEQLRRDKQRVLQWHCAAHLSNRPLHPVVRELEMAAGITRGMPAEARRRALETYVANFPGLGDDDLLWLADLLGLHNPDRPDLDAATRATACQRGSAAPDRSAGDRRADADPSGRCALGRRRHRGSADGTGATPGAVVLDASGDPPARIRAALARSAKRQRHLACGHRPASGRQAAQHGGAGPDASARACAHDPRQGRRRASVCRGTGQDRARLGQRRRNGRAGRRANRNSGHLAGLPDGAPGPAGAGEGTCAARQRDRAGVQRRDAADHRTRSCGHRERAAPAMRLGPRVRAIRRRFGRDHVPPCADTGHGL